MLLAINWLLVRRLGALDRPFAETRSQCCRGLSGVGGVKIQHALGKACMGVLGGLMILRHYILLENDSQRTAALLVKALHSRFTPNNLTGCRLGR
jgi:hypothetical protein